MHELSITESILEIALRHARHAGASRVTDLYLVIGELSSVVDDSVQFYWDFVSEGTEAEGATLHFRRIPAQFNCRSCGHVYGTELGPTCPECGGTTIHIQAGQEFYLDAIEVDACAAESAHASTETAAVNESGGRQP